MDRLKGSLILTLTPNSKFDVNLSLNTIDDEYKGEGHEFGLLTSKNTSLNLSANFYASDKVTFGAMYGIDKYSSNQASRNANPFSGWPGIRELDMTRTATVPRQQRDVKSAGVWVDLIKALPTPTSRFASTSATRTRARHVRSAH